MTLRRSKVRAEWIALGIALGVLLGAAADNLPIGLLLGLALGVAVGTWQAGRAPAHDPGQPDSPVARR